MIFVTSRDEDVDEEKGFLLGAVDYITKPVRPTIVKARVQTHIELKRQRDLLENMAMHDQLTGLFNRHYLLEVANHKVARALRYKQAFSLLMIDIDFFKKINDTHGHLKGDVVLQKISRVLDSYSRQEDVVARFGGEEFLMLIDQCDMYKAANKARALCKNIENLEPEGIPVTVSIGVAEFNQDKESFSDLLIRVDDVLYKAKNNGRNCVVMQ